MTTLKRQVKHVLFALVMLFIPLGLFMCGCRPAPIDKTTLLLDWWPNPNHVPLYVGLEQNIFARHGIELKILNLQEPPDALNYVLSNKIDVALYYFPLCLAGYAHTPAFKIIGKLHEHALYTFMCRKDSNITSIEDLHGKTLGAFGSTLSTAALYSLEKKGIRPGALKLLQFEPITMLYTQMLDLVCDVYWNIEPFQLRSQGIDVQCFTWEDLQLPDYPELVFIASQQFLHEHPTFSQRFQQALQESITYSVQHPSQAFDIYLKQHREKKRLTWEQEAWNATYPTLAHSQNFDRERLEIFYQWLEDCKILQREFNVGEMLEQNP